MLVLLAARWRQYLLRQPQSIKHTGLLALQHPTAELSQAPLLVGIGELLPVEPHARAVATPELLAEHAATSRCRLPAHVPRRLAQAQEIIAFGVAPMVVPALLTRHEGRSPRRGRLRIDETTLAELELS